MTSNKMNKKLSAVVSGLAFGLTIFLAAQTASAASQDSAGWYETEDSLPVIHLQNEEKIVKDSEGAYVTTGNNLVNSWYETEDALPFSGIQNSKASAQKGSAERYVNRVDLWAETEDALPKI